MAQKIRSADIINQYIGELKAAIENYNREPSHLVSMHNHGAEVHHVQKWKGGARFYKTSAIPSLWIATDAIIDEEVWQYVRERHLDYKDELMTEQQFFNLLIGLSKFTQHNVFRAGGWLLGGQTVYRGYEKPGFDYVNNKVPTDEDRMKFIRQTIYDSITNFQTFSQTTDIRAFCCCSSSSSCSSSSCSSSSSSSWL